MKISKHLAEHAISELLQMGYTVDGDRLNPPEKLSDFACKFFGVRATADSFQMTAADARRYAEMESSSGTSDFAAGIPPADSVTAPAGGNWIDANDVNRLVRELDVALNGEAGAAAQASLCDVVAQVRLESAKRGQPLLAPQADSQPAPSGGVVVTDGMVLAALRVQYPAAYGQYLRHPANGPKTSLRTESEIDTARRMIVAALSAATTPPAQPNPLRAALLKCIAVIERTAHCNEADRLAAADEARQALATQAADSVLEDAARWQMLPAFFEEYQIDAMKLYRDIDAAVDAARKQGANHD